MKEAGTKGLGTKGLGTKGNSFAATSSDNEPSVTGKAMKITIQGTDYTAALDAVSPLTIERKINEPSVCQFWLSLPAGGSLAAPARFQPVAVTGDDGTPYFTGYLAVSPLPEYAGVGITGPVYRTVIQAVSDEWLLDWALMPPRLSFSNLTAAEILALLIQESGSKALSSAGLTLGTPMGSFTPEHGANWSKNAGQVASMSRSAYRALNGAVTLNAVQSTVHPLNETDGTLNLASLALTSSVKRSLANDVTVCGEEEPAVYVTEYFLGDGATAQFVLAEEPYFPPATLSILIYELFEGPNINPVCWAVNGTNYIALGANGLVVDGGNGYDGETTLTWLNPIEMGGTLLLELVGVTLAANSTGILGGFFNGGQQAADCVAGIQVTAQSGTGAVSLQPIVMGAAAGSAFAVSSANEYTLRLRIHCPDSNRFGSMFYSYGDSGLIGAGGAMGMAPGKIQMEVQEFVNGVGATPVILYDGGINNLAAPCDLIPVSSINLIGTVRAIHLNNLGSGWVVSTPPSSGAYTRRIGPTSAASECYIQRIGRLVFYTGYTPVVGEQIAVSYRTNRRAAGRAVNTANQQALQQAGSPWSSAWIGSVTRPPARSSEDCRNAALVISLAAASVSALWNGTYKGNSTSFTSDVWPGDGLLLNAPSTNLNAQVVVRSVKVSYSASLPDAVEYEIAFANDWADDLAILTSQTVPMKAWLPSPINPTYLANLSGLTVTALSGSTVTVNPGVTPPTGGGFEVRLRDYAFQADEDPTLVVRGSGQTLTFSRVSASDRFYIRMYDGSTPPNYSEFSTALFINLPLSS